MLYALHYTIPYYTCQSEPVDAVRGRDEGGEGEERAEKGNRRETQSGGAGGAARAGDSKPGRQEVMVHISYISLSLISLREVFVR